MSKELDLSTMENCVCFNLRWVTRAVTQFFDAELRRHGIRPTQTPILGALQAKSSLGMAELSDWLGLERTTLVRNLRPLQRDGLVRVAGGGRGGRVELAITEDRKTLAKMLPRGVPRKRKWSKRWVNNVGPPSSTTGASGTATEQTIMESEGSAPSQECICTLEGIMNRKIKTIITVLLGICVTAHRSSASMGLTLHPPPVVRTGIPEAVNQAAPPQIRSCCSC
jgi:DNA-binding MarR family transcriptional regulator